jgi:hypothetical protein
VRAVVGMEGELEVVLLEDTIGNDGEVQRTVVSYRAPSSHQTLFSCYLVLSIQAKQLTSTDRLPSPSIPAKLPT